MRTTLAFLTVLPVRPGPQPPSGVWFPAIGAGIGAVAGGVAYLAEPSLGALVAAVLAVLALVVLTGALHQDGLADCADAVGARGGRERRLEAMRDSQTGAFGTLAVLLYVLLLVAAVASLGRGDMLRALVVATTAGRWAALLHTAAGPPARRDGLGRGFAVTPSQLVVATVTGGAIALAVAGVWPGLAALGAAAAIAGLVTLWSRAAVGGRTGDTLGATVALSEAAVAVVLLGLL